MAKLFTFDHVSLESPTINIDFAPAGGHVSINDDGGLTVKIDLTGNIASGSPSYRDIFLPNYFTEFGFEDVYSMCSYGRYSSHLVTKTTSVAKEQYLLEERKHGANIFTDLSWQDKGCRFKIYGLREYGSKSVKHFFE